MSSRRRTERTLGLGVAVPVHNEQDLLEVALDSITDSLHEVREFGLACQVVVVLDACADYSEWVVADWQRRHARTSSVPVSRVTCQAQNVGVARGLGCSVLLANLRGVDPGRVWLATTDADSRVPKRWLRAQLLQHEADYDVWAGRVRVTDWTRHRRALQSRWQRDYESEHQPIHGANLGFNAGRYLSAGGFPPLRTGEDRALVRAMAARGADCYFDDSVRVITSARREARAPQGFSHALNLIEATGGQRFD